MLETIPDNLILVRRTTIDATRDYRIVMTANVNGFGLAIDYVVVYAEVIRRYGRETVACIEVPIEEHFLAGTKRRMGDGPAICAFVRRDEIEAARAACLESIRANTAF